MIDYVCIIPSALGTRYGTLSIEERFNQTLEGIASIREKIPNSYIILGDISLVDSSNYREIIKTKVDSFIDCNDDQKIIFYSNNFKKSQGELLIFKKCLDKVIIDLDMTSIKRIFKIGGRVKLSENFDITDYKDTKDKYVFRFPVDSWMGESYKFYETRIYSFDSSLISDYYDVWDRTFNLCDRGFDVEHAYYQTLDQNKIYHVVKSNAQCQVAATAGIAYD